MQDCAFGSRAARGGYGFVWGGSIGGAIGGVIALVAEANFIDDVTHFRPNPRNVDRTWPFWVMGALLLTGGAIGAAINARKPECDLDALRLQAIERRSRS